MIIYVCSPLKGNIEANIDKAKGYCRDIILQGNIPIAPHIYFTQFLDDTKEEERTIGMEAGIELLKLCDELWVYGEHSYGMQKEIDWWLANTNKPIKEISYGSVIE